MTKTKNNLGSVPFFFFLLPRVYTRREMMWRKEKAIDDPEVFLDIFPFFGGKSGTFERKRMKKMQRGQEELYFIKTRVVIGVVVVIVVGR